MKTGTVSAKTWEFKWNQFKVGLANDLRTFLAQAAPVDTGALKASIKYRVTGKTIEIYMKDYAMYVEFGTPPHIIRPKNGKALAWGKTLGQTKSGKPIKEFVAKVVHHPGTRPQPFIRNTFRNHFARLVRLNLKRAFT